MLIVAGCFLLLLVLLCGLWLGGALYRHFVRFPREEKAWRDIRLQHRVVADNAGWSEFRGIIHSHSALSHDCEVSFETILQVLKTNGIDFICLSDHATAGRADFSAQWRGVHDGKLFIPGFEMKEGIMPFGVAEGVVLSNQTDSATLVRQIVEHGGILFYAHPEEPRAWDRPELSGMEIYNIHADFKSGSGLRGLLPDIIVNQHRYPEHVFRRIFHPPAAILAKWDQLNCERHITGIAGNDCHQNTGLRARVVSTNTIRLDDTGRHTVASVPLNWLTRPLARLCFGPLDLNRELFHLQLDPYERMGRFVNTHLLAHTLAEPDLLDALRAGRAFVGFDSLASSAGFRWFATNATGRVVIGESIRFSPGTSLRALSPEPCRFTVLNNGTPVYQHEGYALEWQPPSPGKYRVEAELHLLGEWVPWVYANPIELQ